MLALLGALTVVVLLAVIMLNLLSPLVALIAVPIIAALLGGFGLTTSKFIITGISGIAPVAGMFVFAILYFGIMTDAGMLDPIIDRILRAVGSKPTRIVVGTALLALADPSRRLWRGLLSRHDSGDAAALREARNGPPRIGLRGLIGSRREFPALDRPHAPGFGGAENSCDGHLPADDRCPGGRSCLCFFYSLAARQTRGTAAWPGGPGCRASRIRPPAYH